MPRFFKTRLAGKTKNIIRRKRKHRVLASRTDEFAQWVFMKSWIQEGRELGMQVFCSVDKTLPDEDRYIRCSAKYMDKKREIEGVRNKKVTFPAA